MTPFPGSGAVGLLVYVLVGGTTATIVPLRQREAASARQREAEAVTAAELSAVLLRRSGVEAILKAVVDSVRRLFDVSPVAALVVDDNGLRTVVTSGEGPEARRVRPGLRVDVPGAGPVASASARLPFAGRW